MLYEYFEDVGHLHIYCKPKDQITGQIHDSEEIFPGVFADLGINGVTIALEIMNPKFPIKHSSSKYLLAAPQGVVE